MDVKLRMRERKVKGKVTRTTLYLSWWISGERKWHIEPLKLYLYPGKDRKAQNEETLALAKTIRTKRQAALDAGEFGMVPEYLKRGDFVSYIENIAKTGDHNWKHALHALKLYTSEPISFRSLTFENGPRMLVSFQNYLLSKYKNNTAWLIEAKIRAAIRKALIEGIIARDFLVRVRSIRYQRPPHSFCTKEDIEKLIRTPFPEYPDVRRAALFSIFTGLRWCDYSRLTWKDIQDGYICFTQKKTKESTQLPINSMAKKFLFDESPKIINPVDRIFSLPGYGRTLQLLKRWTRRAGIADKKFTTHHGRHTFGHLLASSGFDSYSIQQALGQRTMSSALVYTHLVKEDLKQKIDERLPEFALNLEAK